MSTGVDVAYIRVSSTEQNTIRQLSDAGIGFARTFTDKCSGGSADRPALTELKQYVRSGDVIHVHSIDRLARSLDDLRSLVIGWVADGVSVRFYKEGLLFASDRSSPMSELMLNMLGAVAQFERSMIKERQREGIAKAKAEGKYTGRKADSERYEYIYRLKEQGVSLRKIAAQVGCSLSTVQRALAAR